MTGGQGQFYSAEGADKAILLRMKEGYDGAEPSANSIAALNLLRLARITDDAGLRDRAEQTPETVFQIRN